MIYIKNADEIERIRKSNQIVAESLVFIKDFIQPGVSTGEINKEIENFILKKKAKPAFMNAKTSHHAKSPPTKELLTLIVAIISFISILFSALRH